MKTTKVKIEKLKGLNLEKGEKLLLENGYLKENECVSNDVDDICIEDIYFTLYDENDNKIHQISYASYWHGLPDDIDPDCFKEKWEEIEI